MQIDTNSYKTISEKTYWMALAGMKVYREQLEGAKRSAQECNMPEEVEYLAGRIVEVDAAIAELVG